MPMDVAIKAEWTRRLRSGEYTKIKGRLRGEGNCRCVMGVFVDVAAADSWRHDKVTGLWFSDGERGRPSSRVLEAAGLATYRSDFLIRNNDQSDSTFAALADLIDAEPTI